MTAGAELRRDAALEGLERFGASFGLDRSAVAVRTFERDFADGARGCYTSHLAVYREALAEGLPAALVFEDNLAYVDLPEDGADASAAAQRPLDWAAQAGRGWDVLHLALVHSAASLRLARLEGGGSVVRVERTAPDWYGFVPIERAPGLGTTAYLISRRAMEAIVELDDRRGYTGMPIDDLLACTFPGSTYAACPVLLHRGSSPSLINPAQGTFRAVMYNPGVFRFVEQALVTTGLSSSGLVWAFLCAMAAWTVGVTLPLSRV
eukprot:CAMPEP_0175782348 /NCGR_PEP_ID=MMETSP0097-20121207/77732_1 /TAXON_ID=311494 /ORGANISM="Alexandrium monilatum, Strain CCMP3105" /LENGTH=263 /DNA_ID=CAMNT_0017093157 /DNA_START=98 /DNA_END=886 /DNA_ORIENTATION=-